MAPPFLTHLESQKDSCRLLGCLQTLSFTHMFVDIFLMTFQRKPRGLHSEGYLGGHVPLGIGLDIPKMGICLL